MACNKNEGEEFASTIHLRVRDRVLIYQLGNENSRITLAHPPHSLQFPRKVVNIRRGLPIQEPNDTLKTLFERHMQIVTPNFNNKMVHNWRAHNYSQDQLLFGSLVPYGAYLMHVKFV